MTADDHDDLNRVFWYIGWMGCNENRDTMDGFMNGVGLSAAMIGGDDTSGSELQTLDVVFVLSRYSFG